MREEQKLMLAFRWFTMVSENGIEGEDALYEEEKEGDSCIVSCTISWLED